MSSPAPSASPRLPWDIHPALSEDRLRICAPRWPLPEHALFVDGVLIPARCLINGCTVTQDTPAVVEYFHVELDRHDVLLAEDLPAESYLDTGNRTMFGNAPVTALHPSAEVTGSVEACAPLVLDGAALDAVRARLQARVPLLAA